MKKCLILFLAMILMLLSACTELETQMPAQLFFSGEKPVPAEKRPDPDYEAWEKKKAAAELAGDWGELIEGIENPPENTPAEEEKQSWIITLHHTGENKSYLFTLTKIDAKTAETTTFKQFLCSDTAKYYYAYPGHKRTLFSEDFSKLAIDRISVLDEERSIGWMNAGGEWIDVSEALELKGEYYSVGFFADRFIFKKVSASKETFYSVPFDDLKIENITDGNPTTPALTPEELEYDWLKNIEVTSWFDDGNCIVNEYSQNGVPVNTLYFDRQKQLLTNYVPSGARTNVEGVISPDETKIAFVSIPYTGNGTTGIFITKLVYDKVPYKLQTELEIMEHCNFDKPDVPVTIDWIE